MPITSVSIKAIELARAVFESIHGNLGLLKFNIEELTPKNGSNGKDSKKWEIICNFYETLGSSVPSHYKVLVNLDDNTVKIKKIDEKRDMSETKYKVVSEKKKIKKK